MSEDRYNPVRRSRRRRRRRRHRSPGIVIAAAVVLVAGAAAISLPMAGDEQEEMQLPTPVVAIPVDSLEPSALPQVVTTPEPTEDPYESEKIEQALVEQGYFRDDVPLTYEEQD